MEADDLLLVENAKGGDSEAYRKLVIQNQRRVYAVALGIVKDKDLAWDVSQEAFVRAYQHLGEFKGQSAFSTWMMRIVTHLAIDTVRKERSAYKEELDEVRESDLEGEGYGILATNMGNDPQQSVLRIELMDQIQAALAELPEKHRTILVLREVDGLSYEELAERLGLHRGTVMSRLFHARKKMQALLREYSGLGGGLEGEEEAKKS